MAKHNVEVEIKSLLGSKENVDKLISRMRELDNSFTYVGNNSQLNHYFVDGNFEKLLDSVHVHLDDDSKKSLQSIIKQGKSHSVRTRKADATVILVVKATVDDTTSENGTARLEFESQVPVTIDELDALLLKSDFNYQAKWSRERQEFKYKDYNVSIDKNAGYGYLAEFECIVDQDENVEAVKQKIRDEFALLGIEELPQDRLARMFDFYNANWKNYYGTEKTFTIL